MLTAGRTVNPRGLVGRDALLALIAEQSIHRGPRAEGLPERLTCSAWQLGGVALVDARRHVLPHLRQARAAAALERQKVVGGVQKRLKHDGAAATVLTGLHLHRSGGICSAAPVQSAPPAIRAHVHPR